MKRSFFFDAMEEPEEAGRKVPRAAEDEPQSSSDDAEPQEMPFGRPGKVALSRYIAFEKKATMLLNDYMERAAVPYTAETQKVINRFELTVARALKVAGKGTELVECDEFDLDDEEDEEDEEDEDEEPTQPEEEQQ